MQTIGAIKKCIETCELIIEKSEDENAKKASRITVNTLKWVMKEVA